MTDIAQLASRFKKVMSSSAEAAIQASYIAGRIVATEDDNGNAISYVLDEDGGIETNQVWVRLEDSEQTLITVYNLKTEWVPNAPVWVELTPEGYVIKGIREKSGTELYADAASTINSPVIYGEAKSGMTFDARGLVQGRVTLSTQGGLFVSVGECLYVDANGVLQVLNGGDLDLTPYLPTTTDWWAWVWVGIDSTGALTAATSTEVPFQDMLSMSLLKDTSVGSMTRLDALQLRESDTSLSANNIFTFGRVFLRNDAAGGSGGGVSEQLFWLGWGA
jgi:hypothetical protein